MPTKFKYDFKVKKSLSSQTRSGITPRSLSVILLVLALMLISIIAFPLSKIFSGTDGWIVNQGLYLFTIPPFSLPVLGTFSIGEVFIRFYAVSMLLGVLSGYGLALYLANRSQLSASIIDNLFLGILIFSLLGARIGYVLFNLSIYQEHWIELANLSKGGLSFFGAIFGGITYLIYYSYQHKFSFFELVDILAPAVLIGQVLGRWGNFFNYEAYGPSTGLFWKMYVPEAARLANGYGYDNLNVAFFHPTFLYEIILNFILLLIILWFYDNLSDKKSGFIFAFYAIGYGFIRFICEFFRLDALRILLPNWLHFNFFGIIIDKIMISQVFAVGLIIVGMIVIFKRRNILFLHKTLKEIKI